VFRLFIQKYFFFCLGFDQLKNRVDKQLQQMCQQQQKQMDELAASISAKFQQQQQQQDQLLQQVNDLAVTIGDHHRILDHLQQQQQQHHQHFVEISQQNLVENVIQMDKKITELALLQSQSVSTFQSQLSALNNSLPSLLHQHLPALLPPIQNNYQVQKNLCNLSGNRVRYIRPNRPLYDKFYCSKLATFMNKRQYGLI
jgi:hypothetical protein